LERCYAVARVVARLLLGCSGGCNDVRCSCQGFTFWLMRVMCGC